MFFQAKNTLKKYPKAFTNAIPNAYISLINIYYFYIVSMNELFFTFSYNHIKPIEILFFCFWFKIAIQIMIIFYFKNYFFDKKIFSSELKRNE
jgi:hypothetical protein